MIVPLAGADGRCGAKALGLRRLIEAGFAVPDGVVVTDLADGWQDAVTTALPRIGAGRYAVRSSAEEEDGTHASYAGQLASELDVPGPDVVAAVRRVAGSGRSAIAYTSALGHRPPARVPVIVQAMVAPTVAGVAFSKHPVTGADQVVIEAVRGSADSVTDGRSTPSRWILDRGTVVASSGPELLTPAQLSEITDATRRIDVAFGPSDVEWAMTGTDLWILQARPITALPGRSQASSVGSERVLVSGTPAGPGVATGPARPIAGPDEFDRFRPGDVLVCRTTSPAWTPLLAHAAAVVTETGGILAHAAIVAREFGIPAVVAASGASAALRDGPQVVVDGHTGVVTAEVLAQ